MWAFLITWRPSSVCPSVCLRPSTITEKSSPLKPFSQFWPNFGGMVLGWSSFKILSDDLIGNPNMAARLKIEKRGDEILKNLLLWKYWANLHQTWLEWSLDGPLSKLCPTIPTSEQNGRQAKNRKKGGWNFKKSSPLKVFSQSSPNLAGMALGWFFTKIVSDDPEL